MPCINDHYPHHSQTSDRILNHFSLRSHLCKRVNLVKLKSKGFFRGAKVSRGRDWKWGDQDGGSEHVGRLSDITSWEHLTRAGARVVWEYLKNNVYRIGYRGLVSCTVGISIFCDLLLIITLLVFVADITRALIG